MSTSPSPDASPERLLPADSAGKGLAALCASWAGWPYRRLLQHLLRGVQCGTLAVELPNGERAEGRGARAGPHASLLLHRWRPLIRLLLQGDTGMAASYRDGDWSSPDLAALLEFGIRNEAGWGHALDASWPSRWLGRLFHIARSNTRRASRENIAFHYDLGNDFYARWLDPELIYSSALHVTGNESLEEAQARKLERIVELLDLKKSASVLEIGCGWGALAIALAGTHDASVTGLTLSAEQLAHARQRVGDRQLEAKIDLRLQDYRDVQGSYDRIVSIEMLEAVGERYWPTYFDTLRSRLKPGGLAVVQVITIADAHFEHYRTHTDFIQRFIFPGGMLPSSSALKTQAERAGLTMETVQTFGESYAITLVEWRRRFLRAWPEIEALGFDSAFRRLWEYYLCYCEAGFRAGRVDVGLYRLAHAQDVDVDATGV